MFRFINLLWLLLWGVSGYCQNLSASDSIFYIDWKDYIQEQPIQKGEPGVTQPLRFTEDSILGRLEYKTKQVPVPTTLSQVSAVDSSERNPFQKRLDELRSPPVSRIITLGKIVWSLIIVLLGLFILKTIHALLNRIGKRSAKYRISIKRILPIIKIIGWFIIIYIVIQGVIRPPLATVFAFFTSVGVAVGFAAQDFLKNVFGGLMILFDRPFQMGDKIEAGNSYGEVIKIGLRSTRIVTADDSVVTIPNGEMMNQTISNSNSGETNCQVVAEFFLPLNVDTQKARQIAIESAMVSKYVYLNKPVAVIFLNEMKDRKSILKMRLKAYVSDIRHEFLFKSDMTEITLKELIKQKVIDEKW